jgi:hypothetical protein
MNPIKNRNPIPFLSQGEEFIKNSEMFKKISQENGILKDILMSRSKESEIIFNAKKSLEQIGLKIASLNDDKRRDEWNIHLSNFNSLVGLICGKFSMLSYYMDMCEKLEREKELLITQNRSLGSRLQIEYQLETKIINFNQ